jgi:uncharacterized protein YcfJ
MFKKLIILPIAFLAFACSSDKKVDDALNADLTTAAQARPYTPLDSVSAAERNRLTTSGATPTTTTRRTTTTTRRTSSGSSGTYSQPAQLTTVVKNTKRDAAIGAVAGAVIGATTSKNKVKGAVVGGAAGAILGAVIGNNVDKKTVKK